MRPIISCIVLSSDSHINKGSSVFASVYSLILQGLENFEIILVENSSQKPNIKLLEKRFKDKIRELGKDIDFKIINLENTENYGEARNIGARKAKSNTLVFIDDDTIVLEKNTLSRVATLAEKYDFGFGAIRYWTEKNIFQRESHKIIENFLETGSLEQINMLKSKPPEDKLKNTYNDTLLTRTFISNFGFCNKQKFWEVGGYISFPGYGFEDDHLTFKLYKNNYKFVIMENMEVLHVTHKQLSTKSSNLPLYFKELVKQGYYWFHIVNLIKNPRLPKHKILEKLKSVHHSEDALKAYENYLEREPLNRSDMNDSDYKYWEEHNKYTLFDYTQKLFTLLNSDTLEHFIKQSSADFDNLGPLIQSALETQLVNISDGNKIEPLITFKHTNTNIIKADKKLHIEPDSKLNQFPCDLNSRKKRLKLIRNRYPYCEYLRLGIIGDDDFISTEFTNDCWVQPIVIEKDKRIIKKIRSQSNNIQILNIDILNINDLSKVPKVGSFITDPPYTLNGSLAFINTGLQILDITEEREFYVVLNKTMIGRRFKDIQKILANADVYLVNIIENFSQYKLPSNFTEYKRANNAIKLDNEIIPISIEYSSSSDLYVFKTKKPNTKYIEDSIDKTKLYNHYV